MRCEVVRFVCISEVYTDQPVIFVYIFSLLYLQRATQRDKFRRARREWITNPFHSHKHYIHIFNTNPLGGRGSDFYIKITYTLLCDYIFLRLFVCFLGRPFCSMRLPTMCALSWNDYHSSPAVCTGVRCRRRRRISRRTTARVAWRLSVSVNEW